MFKGKRFLSTRKTESATEQVDVDNIAGVKLSNGVQLEEVGGSGGSGRLVKGVRIVGIDQMTQYKGCMKCSGCTDDCADDNELGECTRYNNMIQYLDDCKHNISAQLTMKGSNGVPLLLRAFNKVLFNIVQLEQQQNITPRMLLKTHIFNLRHINGFFGLYMM